MFIKKVVNHAVWRTRNFLNITFPQAFLVRFLPGKVLSGPFEGMRYISSSTGSVILPKLIGTYENELHGVLRSLTGANYEKFLDIGAAEGYFAVGISKYLLPDCKNVVAYEATGKGQEMIAALARLNDVKVIAIKGICTVEDMAAELNGERAFILMDVEGAEIDLLQPEKIDFGSSDILLELHPMAVEGIGKTIVERFEQTHEIQEIFMGEKAFPDAVNVPSWMSKEYLTNEFRSQQSWLWMQARR